MSKRPVEEFTGANSFLPMTNKKFRNEGDPGNSRANDGVRFQIKKINVFLMTVYHIELLIYYEGLSLSSLYGTWK